MLARFNRHPSPRLEWCLPRSRYTREFGRFVDSIADWKFFVTPTHRRDVWLGTAEDSLRAWAWKIARTLGEHIHIFWGRRDRRHVRPRTFARVDRPAASGCPSIATCSSSSGRRTRRRGTSRCRTTSAEGERGRTRARRSDGASGWSALGNPRHPSAGAAAITAPIRSFGRSPNSRFAIARSNEEGTRTAVSPSPPRVHFEARAPASRDASWTSFNVVSSDACLKQSGFLIHIRLLHEHGFTLLIVPALTQKVSER